MGKKHVLKQLKLHSTSIKLGLFALKLLVKSSFNIGSQYNSAIINGKTMTKMREYHVSEDVIETAKCSISQVYSALVDDTIPFSLIKKGCENRNLDSSILNHAILLLDGGGCIDNVTLANSLAGIESFIIEQYEHMKDVVHHSDVNKDNGMAVKAGRTANKLKYVVPAITAINNALIKQIGVNHDNII